MKLGVLLCYNMGSYKNKAALSWWERFWNKADYEKKRALKAGDAESIKFYNQSKAADRHGKITQEDIDNFQEAFTDVVNFIKSSDFVRPRREEDEGQEEQD